MPSGSELGDVVDQLFGPPPDDWASEVIGSIDAPQLELQRLWAQYVESLGGYGEGQELNSFTRELYGKMIKFIDAEAYDRDGETVRLDARVLPVNGYGIDEYGLFIHAGYHLDEEHGRVKTYLEVFDKDTAPPSTVTWEIAGDKSITQV